MQAYHYLSRLGVGLKNRIHIQLSHTRSFYPARARFISSNDDGLLVSSETEIRVGDSNEAYVYIEPEIGNTIRSSIMQQTGIGMAQVLKKLPMEFDHRSKHFAHKNVPFPRLEISQDLPRQTDGDISPATLWLSGNWYSLTLNGTSDEAFERDGRESAENLKGAMELLKDS